ncbi:MAG: hypothetical protein AVDCRST_MAG59-2737, partial [uncultured Thermomicrobiales bacterium]
GNRDDSRHRRPPRPAGAQPPTPSARRDRPPGRPPARLRLHLRHATFLLRGELGARGRRRRAASRVRLQQDARLRGGTGARAAAVAPHRRRVRDGSRARRAPLPWGDAGRQVARHRRGRPPPRRWPRCARVQERRLVDSDAGRGDGPRRPPSLRRPLAGRHRHRRPPPRPGALCRPCGAARNRRGRRRRGRPWPRHSWRPGRLRPGTRPLCRGAGPVPATSRRQANGL